MGIKMVNRDDYISYIRRFPTDEIIINGYKLTKEMHDDKCIQCYLNDKCKKQNFFITPWEVLDISFDSVKYSNDFRNRVIGENDLLKLISYHRQLRDKESNFDNIDKDFLISNIVFGLSQEEFWFQKVGYELSDYSRNHEILKIGLRENDKIITDALNSEIGMSFDEYNWNMWVLLVISMVSCDFTNLDTSNLKKIIVNEDILNKIIAYYTATYDDVRKSNVNKNIFFTKPFIKTSKGKTLLTSPFYLYRLFSNGLYWVIRNYYVKSCSQVFINGFGTWFEKYLEQVFNTYLKNYQFEKITEPNNLKKADWAIISKKYLIILEQKSALAKLELKQINPNNDELLKYFKKLSEGYEQLEESKKFYSKKYNNKETVKILVHYENLYIPEQNQDTIEKLIDYNNKDVLMANISEVEGLIYLMSKDESEFEKLIERKLILEKDNYNEGRSFAKLLDEFKVELDYTVNKLTYLDKLKAKMLALETK
jgi:hypothetical protein